MSKRVGESEVVGKSGKKSKRSEKVEMDGVDEIGVCTVVEEDGLGKVGKKSKKSKKKEMDGVDEIGVCMVVEEDGLGKVGKKSKKSKKKEMGGVDEIGVCTVVEEDGLGKVGKKSKKSKKKEMGGVEEMKDHTDVEDVELEQKLESGVGKKKKKSKGNDMVAGAESVNGESFGQIDTDKQLEKVKKKKNKGNIVSGGEPGNKESIEKFDAENRSEKVQKKKKEKRMSVFREEVTDRVDAVVTEEASLNKRGKKLKNVNENQVPVDSSPNDTQDEDNTVEKRKKKKTKRRSFGSSENSDTLKEKPETKAKENSNVVGNVEKKKIKKRKRSVEEDDNDKEKKNSARREDVDNSLVDDGMVAIEKVKKKKRKNEKITDKNQDSRKAQDIEATNVSKKEKTKSVDNDHNNPKSKEQKKVRFSNDNEVFPSSDEEEKGRLVQGKRFTPEEDEIVRAAVQKYIESHCLGEKGLEMVLNCKSHRQVRNCWKEIAVALPHRPKVAIYYRAHILFEGRGERHKWTEEEKKMLREHYEKHGSNWKLLAKEFKRHRFHVKDTWRRIKMERKSGHWSQEEYQKLFDCVNIDLQAKVNEEKKSKHGMLRDNICWSAISDRLSTRGDSLCCMKWYNQLTSSMVAEGIWDVADDYRLLDALFKLDACCIDDVDWDYLIERSGDVCRKRWDQMVLHIGEHKVKSFAEQVEVLAKRYCPELLEAREVWDSKPLVP